MIIKSQNARSMRANADNKKACSCRNTNTCPLNGDCMQTSLVYEAEVHTRTENFKYIGLCEGDLKTRYNTHTVISTANV